jgi:hypothetical protein
MHKKGMASTRIEHKNGIITLDFAKKKSFLSLITIDKVISYSYTKYSR